MRGVILHGGAGTRLRPLTHSGPKQLIKIAGKPISMWGVQQLISFGISELCVVLGENHPEQVVEFYGDGSWLGAKVTYIYQGEPLGLAHAIYLTKECTRGEDFVVYLGDNVVLEKIDSLIKFKGAASILLAKVEDPSRFGVALVEGGRVRRVVEKPKESISDLALVGVYGFTQEVFEVIEGLSPSWRGELEITDAIQGLIDRGKEVTFSVIEGWWKDTGTVRDLLDANLFLLDRYMNRSLRGSVNNSVVEGRVVVEEGALVEGSIIRGPVYIGRESVVKDSRVMPFTSLGERCRVQNSSIENSLVQDGSSIEGVELADSIIGRNSRVSKSHRSSLVVGEGSVVKL